MGSADAEIKVPSLENPELSQVLSFKPGVRAGQIVAWRASAAAKHSVFVIFAFLIHLVSVPQPPHTLQTESVCR